MHSGGTAIIVCRLGFSIEEPLNEGRGTLYSTFSSKEVPPTSVRHRPLYIYTHLNATGLTVHGYLDLPEDLYLYLLSNPGILSSGFSASLHRGRCYPSLSTT